MRFLHTLKQQLSRGRYRLFVLLGLVYLTVSTLTRAALFVHQIPELDNPAGTFLAVMPIGLMYDIVAVFYLFALFAVYLFLVSERLYRAGAHRGFLTVMTFLTIFGILYLAVVEFLFFEEFGGRFDFVAVGYLMYPHEVFVNIWESYPVAKVLVAVAALSAALFWYLRRHMHAGLRAASHYRERLPAFALAVGMLPVSYFGVNINTGRYSENYVANELAQNGVYSFFYAAAHRELNYNKHYLTVGEDEAVRRLRKLVVQPNARFIDGAANPIARHIDNHGPERPLNVIVLAQESLGADFVGAYGDSRGLTPNLDRLAKESLMFTNVYATGTRTVRGLEAISSSFPPIPGEAILKREHNEDIFTWGQVMHAHGYSPTFLYGGYGSFDNMNYFFRHNGFRVIDRADIQDPKFTNIWGVSDEDLFQQALQVFDQQHAAGGRIFSIVMSTSNHKPFTYPDGIPGIQATGGGRLMGVQYADYAIGKFIEGLKSKPYYSDTVVVIVGDHGARVYGRKDIPMRSYELPLLVYAPKHFKPRRVDTLMSQIDIVPTVLGLLNISYDSVSFGRDIFRVRPQDQFVLLSHNRDVALYRPGMLVELGIRKASHTYKYDKASNEQVKMANDDTLRDTISIFQEGFNLYRHGLYRLN